MLPCLKATASEEGWTGRKGYALASVMPVSDREHGPPCGVSGRPASRWDEPAPRRGLRRDQLGPRGKPHAISGNAAVRPLIREPAFPEASSYHGHLPTRVKNTVKKFPISTGWEGGRRPQRRALAQQSVLTSSFMMRVFLGHRRSSSKGSCKAINYLRGKRGLAPNHPHSAPLSTDHGSLCIAERSPCGNILFSF